MFDIEPAGNIKSVPALLNARSNLHLQSRLDRPMPEATVTETIACAL
jgi:hypothetical protein